MTLRTRTPISTSAALLGALLGVAPALADTGYNFTVNQTTSTLTYSFSASAPFGSGGTPAVASTLIGQYPNAATGLSQTRTKRFSGGFSCGAFTSATQNEAITISGTIAASGSSTGSPAIHPGGTFKLGINTTALTCRLQDLNLNLVAAGGPINTTANLNNFTYQSFCATDPSCSAPFLFPISLPLGNVALTSLLVQQAPAMPDSGTLTANGANTWNFSVTTTVTVTPSVDFGGAPLGAAPQTMPMTLSGTITVTGANTATLTAGSTLNYAPPATTPGPQPPTPFSVPAGSPLCSGINILLTLNILSSSVSSNNTANLAAAGTRFNCPCDANLSGALTVDDIFDFINLWFAADPRANFNQSGGIDVQDIFDFINCWFGVPTGC